MSQNLTSASAVPTLSAQFLVFASGKRLHRFDSLASKIDYFHNLEHLVCITGQVTRKPPPQFQKNFLKEKGWKKRF